MMNRPSRRDRRSRTLAALIIGCSLALLSLPGVATAAPPGNDDFADAIVVTEPLPFTDAQDTSEATLEVGEPKLGQSCGSRVKNTVWYSYTPSADTIVSANTFDGDDFDTVLGVWEGAAFDSLSLVGCSDDSRNLQSSVVFLAEMGTEYRIQIGGYSGSSGALSFRLRETAAGVIEGTVTDADSSDPLAGVCVSNTDAAFGDGPGQISLSAEDGTYRLVTRPGEHLVVFVDCQEDAYVPEWWDNAAGSATATEIDVTAGSTTSGIDAALAPACPGFASTNGNQILGTPDPETLPGTDGRDVICGFGGDDVLLGGGGNDIVIGGAGDDTIRGGGDRDRLLGSAGRDALFGGGDRDRMHGGSGRDECDGGGDSDTARSCEVLRNN